MYHDFSNREKYNYSDTSQKAFWKIALRVAV